jgi:hypothetical protein
VRKTLSFDPVLIESRTAASKCRNRGSDLRRGDGAVTAHPSCKRGPKLFFFEVQRHGDIARATE